MVLNQTFKNCAIGAGAIAAVAVSVPTVLFCTDKLATGAQYVLKEISQSLSHKMAPYR